MGHRFELVPHTEPHIQAFTDKEAQQSLVHISFKHPTPRVTTPCEYLESLRESLFQVALNRRFFNIGRRPDPPFYAAQVRRNPNEPCVEWYSEEREVQLTCVCKKWASQQVHA